MTETMRKWEDGDKNVISVIRAKARKTQMMHSFLESAQSIDMMTQVLGRVLFGNSVQAELMQQNVHKQQTYGIMRVRQSALSHCPLSIFSFCLSCSVSVRLGAEISGAQSMTSFQIR